MGLDLPLWVEDEHFDLANHLHRVAVPPPGGDRELAELAGDIMSQQLDRRLPLWQLWFIEGLADGYVALLGKTHHCMMDGASGQGLVEYLFDMEPDAADRPVEMTPRLPDRLPSDLELVIRSLLPTVRRPLILAGYGLQLAQRGLAALPFLAGKDKAVTPMDAPPTPWNASLSPRRRLSFVSVPLGDVKVARQRFDVKVNDVILAVVTTVLRNYLIENGALPAKPLVAGVPISTREVGDMDLGNKFATMFVALPVQVDDAYERLSMIHSSTEGAKAMTRAVRSRHIQPIADAAPPAVLNLVFRTMFSAHLDQLVPAAANILVSDVPGPSFPLYSAGAQVEAIYPIGPLMMGMGLNCTVISYRDSVDFGLQCDPELLPDPWSISDRIPGALAELTKGP